MDQSAVDEAATMLADARANRRPLSDLPESCRPETIAEAHAVQDALVRRLGEAVAGWKVAGLTPGEVMRGAILKSRIHESPASISAADMPLLGMESEIAFRVDRSFQPREAEYSREEVVEAVTALPVIEVVDTRFASYTDTPLLHRLCDCMSNGALICGTPRPDWRDIDLTNLTATLRNNGQVLVSRIGGHANGDPVLPAVALANELRSGPGLRAGQIVAAGSFTGLEHVEAPALVTTEFEGFGGVELRVEG